MTRPALGRSPPASLILSPGQLSAEEVRDALIDQGGPAWDRTVFRMVQQVDIASLLSGQPGPGAGTAVAVASAGYWVRPIDRLAASLAAKVKAPVVAVVEGEDESFVAGVGEDGRAYRRGASTLLSAWSVLPTEWFPALGPNVSVRRAALLVHEDADEGRGLPACCVLEVDPTDEPTNAETVLGLRGAALAAGWPWKPGALLDEGKDPPADLRALVLAGPVRLPGPPRWAVASRAAAVEVAQDVLADDGWVLLVPELNGRPAGWGAATRLRQLAPLPDGRWMGVLQPRRAARVLDLDGDGPTRLRARIELAPADLPEGEGLGGARDSLVRTLRAGPRTAAFVPAVEAADDPGEALAFRIPVTVDRSLAYLAAPDRATRVRILQLAASELAEDWRPR